ncbi:hypothetical protein [Kitasatospora sp. P5_F3]
MGQDAGQGQLGGRGPATGQHQVRGGRLRHQMAEEAHRQRIGRVQVLQYQHRPELRQQGGQPTEHQVEFTTRRAGGERRWQPAGQLREQAVQRGGDGRQGGRQSGRQQGGGRGERVHHRTEREPAPVRGAPARQHGPPTGLRQAGHLAGHRCPWDGRRKDP